MLVKSPVPLWPGFAYKPHQEAGIKWILEHENMVPSGGIVCDEMGLGKTIQLLAILKGEQFSKTLLVAPVAVLSQWEQTATKAGIAVYKPTAGGFRQEWKTATTFGPLAAKLYLIGYEMARNRPYLVAGTLWKRLICDEAHRVGPKKNSLHGLIEKISAKTRWFLTATPIVNSKKDIQGLFSLLGADQSKKTLQELTTECVMARSMDDLRASIPDAPLKPEIHQISLPFLTEEERDFYKGISGIIVKRWKMLEDEMGTGANAALMKLKLFMRLRQLSLHPQVYIEARRTGGGAMQDRDDWVGPSTKFGAMKDLIAKGGTGHKWIIFCHFHSEMELLKRELIALPQVGKVHIYNGSLSATGRQAVLEATLESSPLADVLLIQLQSGGVGLNLQHFDRIIFSGPWWTSALMEQAIGRAVRIGQTKAVHVYHLSLIEEEALNIDKYMRSKADEKGDLCKEILSKAWPRSTLQVGTLQVGTLQVGTLQVGALQVGALRVQTPTKEEATTTKDSPAK